MLIIKNKEKNMAEKSYWDKILDSFGVGSTPKFTNQELGLGSIGNSGANINSDVFKSGSNNPNLDIIKII